jgi:hypothetical protein
MSNRNLEKCRSKKESRIMMENLSSSSVLAIRIRMFLGLPNPDPLVRGMDPDQDLSLSSLKVLRGLK